MGQVGSAGDNAAMESFFALLQKNVLDRRAWATRDDLRIEIITWIGRTYHRRRRQARLGRLTPIEYETIMTPTGGTRRLTTHCHLNPRQSLSIEFWLNVALFVPAGVAWTLLTRRPWPTLAGLAVVSMAIETVQAATVVGAADITDVAANTIGAAFGVTAGATA